ncbi:hypothetical protein CCACVL1_20250 [Corchorus capsularis]|uniref:Uncharacterized protein n=1 Tax=Corchorus capsularis TaxID=210143 RepID=A0A1R3HBZ7_COCAP|nr:hypothetical protein CCACVL1_20250 [Corchorus capsularis]
MALNFLLFSHSLPPIISSLMSSNSSLISISHVFEFVIVLPLPPTNNLFVDVLWLLPNLDLVVLPPSNNLFVDALFPYDDLETSIRMNLTYVSSVEPTQAILISMSI